MRCTDQLNAGTDVCGFRPYNVDRV